MKVSIIIPSYNEHDVISDCLRSLWEQSYKGLEIIVVDDGSSDKTWEVLSRLKMKNKKLNIFRKVHEGPGPARNLGAEKATGKILVFVDSDMTFESSFIEKLAGPIVEGKTKGTFPLDEKVANWSNWWARMWNLETSGSMTDNRLPDNYPPKGPVFRAILKSEFEKVGGFDPIGYNDDWTLATKLGYKATGVRGAVVYHKNPESLGEVWRQAFWVGRRQYKLGALGKIVALVRASLPVSLFVALYKSIRSINPGIFVFKIVYDLSIFLSLLTYPLDPSHAR